MATPEHDIIGRFLGFTRRQAWVWAEDARQDANHKKDFYKSIGQSWGGLIHKVASIGWGKGVFIMVIGLPFNRVVSSAA